MWRRRKLRRALSRSDQELVDGLKRAVERLRAEAQLKGARDESGVAAFMQGRAARLSLKLEAVAGADPRVRALLDELDARLDRAMLA